MRISARLLVCTSTAMVLTAATIITILFATNLPTIANAQQQQQPSTKLQLLRTEHYIKVPMDNFRVQLPEGWVIQDVNNTGSALEAEVLHGYGILAQLCPEEQQQTAPDVGGNRSVSSTFSSICQDSKGNIIHIVRYPNLSATVGFTPDDFISDRNRYSERYSSISDTKSSGSWLS